jgi:hypothetical protein
MIEAIMGVGSGKSFSSVENPSSVLPLEIYSEISSFLMATHPLEMVNHPEEDSIRRDQTGFHFGGNPNRHHLA